MAAALMNVNRDNVLQARAVILAEAEDLMRFLQDKFGPDRLLIGLCGGDPISRDAQRLFTGKIQDNVLAPTQQYIARLQDIAEQLAATARSYGFTEAQIADSFRPAEGRRA